jgi:hypothetical protein
MLQLRQPSRQVLVRRQQPIDLHRLTRDLPSLRANQSDQLLARQLLRGGHTMITSHPHPTINITDSQPTKDRYHAPRRS